MGRGLVLGIRNSLLKDPEAEKTIGEHNVSEMLRTRANVVEDEVEETEKSRTRSGKII